MNWSIFWYWEAPEAILRAAGVVLDADYPKPVVSLTIAREIALQAYRRIKE